MRDIPFGKPMISDEERQAVNRVLQGTTLTHGPLVKEFEQVFANYTGARHAIAVSNATAALHLAYFNLGIGPGDEVIVPAQTHVATAHAVELCGARAVFVDAEIATGNIDIERIEEKINEHTRALSVVHYLGLPVNMDKVMSIARKYGLFVVEDCALALGASLDGRHPGLFGDLGCFSFYPVKHITTGEGGMLITNNDEIASRISRLRAFGIDRNIVLERPVPGMYDAVELGLNYRMNEMGAAMGLEQMKRLPGFLEKRKANYEELTAGLEQIEEIQLLTSTRDSLISSYYCHFIMLGDKLCSFRVPIMNSLKQMGVGTSIYYPQPVPLMGYYRNKYGYRESDCPVAFHLSNSSIAFPVGPHLERDDIQYIVECVKKAIIEVK